MMKKLLAFLLLMPMMSMAQTPLKSATWRGADVSCGTYAAAPDLMPLDGANHWETQNAPPGAGPWPAGYSVTVRKVCITHGGVFTAPAYAVVGHWGPNGDHVSPWTEKTDGEPACLSYDANAPIVVIGGEYFDIHAGCNVGTHHVVLQLWYTQP